MLPNLSEFVVVPQTSKPMLRAAIQRVPMTEIINLNTASAKELTQLPGVAKNVAYNIVSHRKRHGYFTHWEELLEVKEFPPAALDRLKERATLLPIDGVRPEEFGPRRIKAEHLQREAKKPRGYTKAIRSTRNPDRMKRSA
jgi:competence ComEA-like helix-hairpin-helix protein